MKNKKWKTLYYEYLCSNLLLSLTFINTLISLYASLSNSKKNAILCSIDLVSTPEESIKRVLGVDEDCELISSVNYQHFSLDSKGQ